MRVLISWIGRNDLNSVFSDEQGPIISTLLAEQFDQVELLYNYPEEEVAPYVQKLRGLIEINIQSSEEKLSSPVDFSDIYNVASKHLFRLSRDTSTEICVLLSPGTPAMQAVWILLGKTLYPVTFFQSTIEQGVQKVEIPFDISAEFIPTKVLPSDKRLESQVIATEVPIDAAFDDILTQNPHMLELKTRASVMAQRDIPILIYGETGTGKELFARAIHNASKRSKADFVPVNCGAIPAELIDSVLFGHIKGAFTGANQNKVGLFEQANGGTIFLDEFGELPKEAQVRLLRVLQNGEITPVGSTKPIHLDVRVIAATNKNLMAEVAKGNFREDLFYRVAVGVLNLPPIRDRAGDISLLIDKIMQVINKQSYQDSNAKQKKISVKGRNILLSHPWHGNVRELYSTLLRASLWATDTIISESDIVSALFNMPNSQTDVMSRPFNKDFDIHDVMGSVARHYIKKALDESNQNLTQAAQKLGLGSYQTLKGWMDKYQVN
jgi:transcriptional regulator with PAS, ATPase and Fis domain